MQNKIEDTNLEIRSGGESFGIQRPAEVEKKRCAAVPQYGGTVGRSVVVGGFGFGFGFVGDDFGVLFCGKTLQ